jgi:hypothetical protein
MWLMSAMNTQGAGLTRLELKALVAALSSNKDPRVKELFRTIPLLEVASRRYTGFGFYTKFATKDSLRRGDLDEAYLKNYPPTALGLYPGVVGCVHFMVWIGDGQVDCLEAASTGSWPEDETQLVVFPIPTEAA